MIKGGCIEKLCILAKSENSDLKISALWALKNGQFSSSSTSFLSFLFTNFNFLSFSASYESTSEFKRSIVADLTWPYLGSLVDDSNSDIAEKALGILRNVFCTFNDDPVIVEEDNQFGQEQLFSLLESKLLRGEDLVIETVIKFHFRKFSLMWMLMIANSS